MVELGIEKFVFIKLNKLGGMRVIRVRNKGQQLTLVLRPSLIQ